MAQPRGVTGAVRGLDPATVQQLLLATLELLDDGQAFSRADLRGHLCVAAKHALSEQDVAAMEHAFFRSVCPVPVGTGVFVLPQHAEALLRHRDYRLPGGRLQLCDVMQLVGALQLAEDTGAALTPNLAERLQAYTKALRSLGLPKRPGVKRA
jgi:hypothetical protein